MFKEKMKTEAIPERVYELCLMVKDKPKSETELKKLFEPNELNNSSYFAPVKTAASELGLIDVKDKEIYLKVDNSVLESMESMRKYVISNINLIEDGMFFEVTQSYLDLDNKVFEFNSLTDGDLTSLLKDSTKRPIDADCMRAWRFWSSYLGLGLLAKDSGNNSPQMNFMPNMYRFLQTSIDLADFEKDIVYPINEFMDKLTPYCKIAMKDAISTKRLNMAMSFGLRQMHDAGDIEMIKQLDSSNNWFLYVAKYHKIPSEVSHVIVRR